MSYTIIGVLITLIATIGSILLVKNKTDKNQPRQVKLVMFGLNFWGLVFLQLMIWAAYLAVTN